MKTRPKGIEISRMLHDGIPPAEVARISQAHPAYVKAIRLAGSYAKYREKERTRKSKRYCGALAQKAISEAARERARRVIAAVDSGMTYSEAAKHLGLPSRNVVAGIVNRFRESAA